MCRRKTQEEFEKDVFNLVGNEYIVLGKYKNNKTNITIMHNDDNCNRYIYEVKPNNFLNGTRCPKCNELFGSKNTKLTHKEFISIINNLVGEEYLVLTEYRNSKTNIKFRHNSSICKNNEFYMTPNSFITGQRCPKCGIRKRTKEKTKSHKEFLIDFYNIFNSDEYEVIGSYKNAHTRIEILHKACGSKYLSLPYNLLNGAKCNICKIKSQSEKTRKSKEQFIKDVNTLTDEYTVLGDYVNALTEILVRHNSCNYEYYVKPNKFLTGRRCPRCNESKGESEVSKVLTELNVKFKSEYTFEDCRNIYPLPFDFAIFKNNQIYIIEYHGEQHYKPVDFWGGKIGFEYRKNNDKIKRDYCFNNKIKLLEIPYWEFDNIETIINDFLNN